MAITAASVEANGWVLRLTHDNAPGSFASYGLDPDGTPRVSLACVHPGFAPSGGVAVATPRPRTLVATKPLRKPVNPASSATPVLDEIDNGDGTVTVRLALSDFVHATETSIVLSVLAGWRSGEAATSGIAVVNASNFAAALPIMRWAKLGYRRETGSFDLDLVVFSHHPMGVAPVAAVKFTITDGVRVKTEWATALSTSTAYGDALRCYRVTVDPAAATALTAGLLRCDAEVYPWLGAMRATDAAGTRGMTGLATTGYDDGAGRPHVVGYDPAGTRYRGQYLFVDPAGNTTPAAAMVQASHAAAKALAVGSRPATLSVAVQALYLANRALTAANGGTAASRATDGAMIRLAVGVHVPGAWNVTVGITSSEMPVIIEGDPDDADPRANCVLQTQATAVNMRITKFEYRNLRLEIGGTAVTGATYTTLDNVELRGKAGSETNSVAAFLGSVAGKLPLNAVHSKWHRSGSRFGGSTQRVGLLRNCEWSRTADGAAILGGRLIPASEDGTITAAVTSISGQAPTTGASEDVVIAGVDLRSLTGRAWAPTGVPAATAGTPSTSYRRLAFVNNLCERIGGDPQPFFSLGEDTLATMSYLLIEGNSFVAERCNLLYSDPFPASAADADSQLNHAFGNRIANNSFDWAPTKHDAFADPTSAAVRGGTHGYRPQMIEAWSVIYGVGGEGNIDFGRLGGGNFAFEYFGRRSLQLVGATPAWPDDRSLFGTGNGGGSYQPPATSPLIGRGLRASVDRDRVGALRGASFASGATEAPASLDTSLIPATARSGHRAGVALLVWRATLGLANARSTNRAGSPPVLWNGALAVAGAHHAVHGTSPLVSGLLQVLAPQLARHALRDAGAAVLPDLLFATPRLVRIEGDVRVQIVEPNRLLLVC